MINIIYYFALTQIFSFSITLVFHISSQVSFEIAKSNNIKSIRHQEPCHNTHQFQPLPSLLLLLLLIIITCKSRELIGFIYGPSSQLFATKQQIIQANLLSRILSNKESTTTTTTTITTTVTTWMARIATTAEQIYNPHYELAYQHDCKTCILHDAGVIAALFATYMLVTSLVILFPSDNNNNNDDGFIISSWREHCLFYQV